MNVQSEQLQLERTFDAPREEVFRAWTEPEVLRRWWAAQPTWESPLAETDVRVGGRYRLSMRDPVGGEEHTVGGEYVEVTPPERLVYTWTWEGSGSSRSFRASAEIRRASSTSRWLSAPYSAEAVRTVTPSGRTSTSGKWPTTSATSAIAATNLAASANDPTRKKA